MPLAVPVLSVADPREESEGSIDPLGSLATNGRLAERIYPHMTARMSRPRYLTAIAAIARVCEGMQDQLAADGVTPPWLVAEWHVVEAFVRKHPEIPKTQWRGIPGSRKVERVLRSGQRLSARSYLKTPTVFGFTGVYKTLALGLEIVTGDELLIDDGAYELLRAWERDRDLDGFVDGKSGAGARFRDQLLRAVERGVRKGYTDQPNSWSGWDSIVEHFFPSRMRRRESKWIYERLIDTKVRGNLRDPESLQVRGELTERLVARKRSVDGDEEPDFFRAAIEAKRGVSAELRERLQAIDAYESLHCPLEDALHLLLYLSGKKGGVVVDEASFAATPLARQLAARVHPAIERINQTIAPHGSDPEIPDLIARYERVKTASDLFHTVIDHHEAVQRGKPPDGKRPWFERVGSGGIFVRAAYRKDDPPPGTDRYMRPFYRTWTASRFLQDMGRLPR
jgi:hypothetical protein